MTRRSPARIAPLAAFAFLSACSDGGPPTPSRLEVAGGASQTGVVGAALPTAIQARVVDTQGGGSSGLTVSFAAEGGGSFEPTTATTDASGIASSVWTLGTTAGSQNATLSAPNLSSITVTATAIADVPALVSFSVDSVVLDQWADTTTVAVTVTDRFGNSINAFETSWFSTDTNVVQVDDIGHLTSWKAGETDVTASVLSGSASPAMEMAAHFVAEAKIPVRVALQRNPQCQVPVSFPDQPAVSGPPSYEHVQNAFDGAALRYDVSFPSIPGDFDGDGDEDIIVLNFTSVGSGPPGGRVLFWRNQGGIFTDATDSFFGGDSIRPDHPHKPLVADFNGDGVPDAFVGHAGFDAPPFPGAPNLLLLSQPGGTMGDEAATHLNPYETDGFTHYASSADFDCDGDVDLFTVDIGSSRRAPNTHLFINSGTGVLIAEDQRLPPQVASNDQAPLVLASAACDVDRDGDSDLFAGLWFDGSDRDKLLINDGFANFREAPAALPLRPFGVANETSSMVCEDLDLDGWPDVVVLNATRSEAGFTTHLSIWRNSGDLVFEDVTSDWSVLAQVEQDLVGWVRDLNGDGWPDIVRGNDPSGQLLINQGGSGFMAMDGPAGGGMILVDVNGDGIPDFVSPGLSDGLVKAPPELFIGR